MCWEQRSVRVTAENKKLTSWFDVKIAVARRNWQIMFTEPFSWILHQFLRLLAPRCRAYYCKQSTSRLETRVNKGKARRGRNEVIPPFAFMSLHNKWIRCQLKNHIKWFRSLYRHTFPCTTLYADAPSCTRRQKGSEGRIKRALIVCLINKWTVTWTLACEFISLVAERRRIKILYAWPASNCLHFLCRIQAAAVAAASVDEICACITSVKCWT